MKKRMWKTVAIPCLAITVLMSIIHSAYAAYNTLYLSSGRNNFYTEPRTTSGSFTYIDRSGISRTAQYTIGSSVQYWIFNYKYKQVDTQYVSYGDIRVCGGANVVGYQIGVMKVTVELRLYPDSQPAEIYIQQYSLATIGLIVSKSGDQALWDITSIVCGVLWSAIPGLGPFDPVAIAYLFIQSPNDLDKDAGPSMGDPTAHVTGRAKEGSAAKTAEVAFDFAYWYLQGGASGWRSYELGIKVSVDFGYWRGSSRTGWVPYVAASRIFDQRWLVYILW